ncbi:MAG: endonuclease/exonuclease/phosphatase family protein [Bacteroidota bacterium]
MLRKILRYTLLLLLVFGLYVGGTLLHGTLTDWQPAAKLPVTTFQQSKETVIEDSIISLAIWNIGYSGLGEESDFFFDYGGSLTSGGHMIHAPQPMVEKNMQGAELFTESTLADIFLFQEVDLNSSRSYGINQLDRLRAKKPEFAASHALNYKVSRVPLPILEPWRAYGKVNSGIANLSRWQPYEEIRYQLPGEFDWPTRIFQLDRCLILSRYKTAQGPDLVLINAHFSAYDKGGELKKQQMEFLKSLVLENYEVGNYVLVGADWNQCPPYFPFDTFSLGESNGYTQTSIDPEFLPADWQWIYDPTIPSNRKLRGAYTEDSFTTVIDFFLASPNLTAKRIKTIDQQFRFSDHQPVYLEIEFSSN